MNSTWPVNFYESKYDFIQIVLPNPPWPRFRSVHPDRASCTARCIFNMIDLQDMKTYSKKKKKPFQVVQRCREVPKRFQRIAYINYHSYRHTWSTEKKKKAAQPAVSSAQQTCKLPGRASKVFLQSQAWWHLLELPKFIQVDTSSQPKSNSTHVCISCHIRTSRFGCIPTPSNMVTLWSAFPSGPTVPGPDEETTKLRWLNIMQVFSSGVVKVGQ